MLTRRVTLIAAAIAMALVFATAAACGDSSDDGSSPASDGVGGFAGVVADAGGAPVADMRVAIVSGSAAFPELAAITDADGAYSIGGVLRGRGI